MITINKAKEKNGAEKITQHSPHSFATETKPNTSHAIMPRKIKQLRINLRCKSDRLLNVFISIRNPNSKFLFSFGFSHDFFSHFCPFQTKKFIKCKIIKIAMAISSME